MGLPVARQVAPQEVGSEELMAAEESMVGPWEGAPEARTAESVAAAAARLAAGTAASTVE